MSNNIAAALRSILNFNNRERARACARYALQFCAARVNFLTDLAPKIAAEAPGVADPDIRFVRASVLSRDEIERGLETEFRKFPNLSDVGCGTKR